MIPDKRDERKAAYIRRCSNAKLAAMYLNNEITTDEYFEVLEEKDSMEMETAV